MILLAIASFGVGGGIGYLLGGGGSIIPPVKSPSNKSSTQFFPTNPIVEDLQVHSAFLVPLDALNYLEENEGGFCKVQGDSGGATNLGISLRFLQGLGIDKTDPNSPTDGDINNDGVIDEQDILGLTAQDARILYGLYFWIPSGADRISGRSFAVKHFDFAVNAGVSQAVKCLQRAANTLRFGDLRILECDGKFGPRTMEFVNRVGNHVGAEKITEAYVTEIKKFYYSIIAKNPTLKKFENGWLKRAERIPNL